MASSHGWKSSLATLVRRNRHHRPTGRRRTPRFDFCEPRTLMTTGAIYTTLESGATVNANIYDNKNDVYLDGGPQNQNAQGLTPGTYYFQVTNPNGSLLLSTDSALNRIVNVNAQGVFASSQPQDTIDNHPKGSFNPANGSTPLRLMDFLDTDNPGGEYKVWLISTQDASPVPENDQTVEIESRFLIFRQNADVKTDNFKVRLTPPPHQSLVELSGVKFEDTDGDGVFDATESGLANFAIHVQLTLPGGSTVDLSTVTNADGEWLLQSVLPVGVTPDQVTFTAQEVQQADYQQTAPTDKSTTGDATADGFVWSGRFDATSGDDSATGLNFGNFELFDLCGLKSEDLNGDGSTLGDPGLADVTIFIDADGSGSYNPDPNGNGELDPGEDRSTTTADDGSWCLKDLGPGYAGKTVREVLPDGYVQTVGMAGYPITGTSGADQAGLDFANFQTFCLSGTKYTDTDGDGLTAGDIGLGGVTVFIDMNDPGQPGYGVLDPGERSTTTDLEDGSWSFTDLGPGYTGKTVREVVDRGYTQTLGMAGYPITGTSGADQAGLDFANFKNITISGLKYYDYDGDKEWANTSAEPAIAGWTVVLTVHSGPFAGTTKQQSTDTDGNYTFGDLDDDGYSDLGPGTYTITEVLPANWVATQGKDGYQVTAGKPTTVGAPYIQSGGASVDNWFGNFKFTPVTGGYTLGFWSNKNGLARIRSYYPVPDVAPGTTPTASQREAAALTDLRALNLRKPDGKDFDPSTLVEFQTWLLNASATNMQSMLSAQLAATYLNVKSGSMNGNSIIQLSESFAGSTYAQILQAGGANVVNGCISVNDLIAAANTALSNPTPTIGASAARTYQEAMKNLLDALNNNGTASGVSLKFVIAVDPLKVLPVDLDGDGITDRSVVTLGDGI